MKPIVKLGVMMSFFVYNAGISYLDYLKGKQYLIDINTSEQRIKLSLSHQTREIIATIKDLSANNFQFHHTEPEQAEYETLSYNIRDMLSERGDLTAKIHCAYGNLLIKADAIINNPVEQNELTKQMQQSPSYKLIDKAKMIFLQGSYREALDVCNNNLELSVTSAIAKPGWQVYQLMGILYLGFADGDLSLVNLNNAESSFDIAGQMARDDNPFEAAKSYMLAGWAAYCNGRMSEAATYMENAINLSRILSEAKFLMAKILIAQDDIEKAMVYLSKAIETDPYYAVKAAAESDFQKQEESLRALLESIREKYAFYLSNLKHDFEIALSDKDVFSVVEQGIQNVIEDKSILSYVSEYRRLSKSFWVVTEGTNVITEIKNVIVKQENWYSNKVIEQVKEEHEIPYLVYNLVGSKHNIDFTYVCNLVAFPQGDFYIGKTLVTQALWNTVMGHKMFHIQGPNYPAYEVNWYDCIKFCNKYSILLGLKPYYHIRGEYNCNDWSKGYIECDYESDGFRLPTEAEWEYAAKGGNLTHKYPYAGSAEANDVAWFDKNSKGKIQPVEQKKPNELGLYDMSGNVWEWCWDFYNDTDRRILRGGAFFSSSSLCAVSGRGHASAINPGVGNGLRLARNTGAKK